LEVTFWNKKLFGPPQVVANAYPWETGFYYFVPKMGSFFSQNTEFALFIPNDFSYNLKRKHKERRKPMQRMMMLGVLVSLMMLTGSVYAAETVKIKGEIIDTYCYGLMGAKGESHRQCAMDCIKAGIPAGLLEEGTGKVYVLLPNKDKAGLPKGVVDKAGHTATVTGKVYTTGGSQFLTVESIE
jgi:hypothetical protein